MKTLYQDSHVIISLHETSHKTIEIQWLDFTPGSIFRASLLENLRLARQHQARAWIGDNRLLRAVRPVDLEWCAAEIMVPMSELGVRRLGAVESQDAMNRMGVNAMLATVIPNTQLETIFFPTIEEARAWTTTRF